MKNKWSNRDSCLIMTSMNSIKNVVEYYDELYPTDEVQKKFFLDVLSQFDSPAKYLRIGCGTGNLESFLAKKGIDVTGLDTNPEVLESANLRRRFPNMAIRFFQMSTIEMTHFLGKKFYDVIACLNDKIIFIYDATLMRKFFFDCKMLLKDKGTLILQLHNFNNLEKYNKINLPTRESIRSKLFNQIERTENKDYVLNQKLENSSGKIIPIMQKEKILPVKYTQIKEYALEAGFSSIDFFEDFDKKTFDKESKNLICIIR